MILMSVVAVSLLMGISIAVIVILRKWREDQVVNQQQRVRPSDLLGRNELDRLFPVVRRKQIYP